MRFVFAVREGRLATEILADLRRAADFGAGPWNFGIYRRTTVFVDSEIRLLAKTCSGPRLQARLEQPGKGRPHIGEDQRPQYSDEEG